MTLKEVLRLELEQMYSVTEALFELVDDGSLDWKPSTGSNWMNTGQLIMHCATACGSMFRGYISNDWSPPEGYEMPEGSEFEGLPPAEALPSAASVDNAMGMLKRDRKTALENLEKVDESRLLSHSFAPPWGGPEMTLFQHLLMSIWHLGQHKGQLFYYLKLQGQDVDTHSLWGM
ncbi:MAG: DinB family protein [Rhodothermia bacterium]|nr:DinB family protein [Rhodothermia bacterium]